MTVFVLMLTEVGMDVDSYENFLETKCIGVFEDEAAVEKAVREGLPQYKWEANPRLRLTWQTDVIPRDAKGVSFVSAKAEEWEVQS